MRYPNQSKGWLHELRYSFSGGFVLQPGDDLGQGHWSGSMGRSAEEWVVQEFEHGRFSKGVPGEFLNQSAAIFSKGILSLVKVRDWGI